MKYMLTLHRTHCPVAVRPLIIIMFADEQTFGLSLHDSEPTASPSRKTYKARQNVSSASSLSPSITISALIQASNIIVHNIHHAQVMSIFASVRLM
jgi:hypothetical protein